MSTFTRIKTSIRDAEAMNRVLTSIPDARVERNVNVPAKGGGFVRCDFRVALGNSPVSTWGALGAALRGHADRIRLFFVTRADDGTFAIQINQALQAHGAIEQSLRSAIQVEEAFEQMAEQGLRRTQAHQQAEAEAAAKRQAAERLDKEARAKAEADELLERLDGEPAVARSQQVAAPAGNPALPVSARAGASRSLEDFLAQQYAKEKVVEQLEDVERQFGVSLGGIETLEDGTIEIILRG